MDSISIFANAEPIELGSMLFTIVEPHRGYEVEYNRWYERDHLYSGCMIGPYNFAAKRFVATSALKALRYPKSSSITGDIDRGSYLALYWILKGYGDIWGKWAGKQVMALHEAGRMFEQRDHVHTQLYDFDWPISSTTDGVPAELVLDHPYQGVIVEFFDRNDEVEASRFEKLLADHELYLQAQANDRTTSLVFRPQEMKATAPGVKAGQADPSRYLVLTFTSETPEKILTHLLDNSDNSQLAQISILQARLGFIPTIPGTDTYCDQLWAD